MVDRMHHVEFFFCLFAKLKRINEVYFFAVIFFSCFYIYQLLWNNS